ncbi:MAG TPA: ABC transporter permease [Gaiellaceae bacterium]|nr:ABC transporter permease [Gaiellaceae bacterium]
MAQVGGVLLAVTLGQACALLVGGFDLSVAANMGFVGVLGGDMMVHHGLAAGIVAGVAAGVVIGLVNGLLIAGLGVSPFVVTLGMLTFLKAFGNEIAHGAPIFGFPSSTQFLGHTGWGPIPSPIAIAAILAVGMWVVLGVLRAGTYIYGIGGNREACRAAGVPVLRYEVLAYVLCGTLASVAGLMELSRVSIGYVSNGSGDDLLSIAAAVIGGVAIGGGTGSLVGVVLGVSVLTVLTTGLTIAGVGEFYQDIVSGGVIVLSVLVARVRGGMFPQVLRLRSGGVEGVLARVGLSTTSGKGRR